MGKNNKQKIMFLSIRDTMFIGEIDMISGTWFHNLKKKGVGEMDEIGWQSCQSRVMEMINTILFLLVFEMLFFLKKDFKIWGKYLAPFPHPLTRHSKGCLWKPLGVLCAIKDFAKCFHHLKGGTMGSVFPQFGNLKVTLMNTLCRQL